MTGKIKIKVERQGTKLTMELPPENLEEAGKTLKKLLPRHLPRRAPGRKEKEEFEEEDDFLLPWDPEYHFSRELRCSREYKELKERMKSYELFTEEYVLDLKHEIKEKGKQLIVERHPDWEDWRRDLRNLPAPFRAKGLKHVLIHLSGSLTKEDQRRILDQLNHTLPRIPQTVISTKSKSERASIELIAYGDKLDPYKLKEDHI